VSVERIRQALNGRLGLLLAFAVLYAAVGIFPDDRNLWIRGVVVTAVAAVGFWVNRGARPG
jgi:hypothetical protein